MRVGSIREAPLQLHALPPPTSPLPQDGKAALCALWCSALLLSGGPAAQASLLDDAFTAAADASFPIVTAVRPDAMDRLTKIAAQASPVELGKAVELGIDVALSVPSDAAATGLSAAFSGISPATCQLFPLPPAGSFDRALVGVDPAKLQAARLALAKLPGRDGGVCVPPRERLPPLVLSQRDALRAADPTKVAAFQAQAQLALKTVPAGVRLGEFGALQAQVGELPERRRLKAALAAVDAARTAEEARRKAALPPTKCFTIGCKSYAMDLGADRKQWEDSIATGPAKSMGFVPGTPSDARVTP